MTNVIQFERPKPARPRRELRVAQQPTPKLADAKVRDEWNAALATIWANPRNWRRSKQGNAYIVIDDLEIRVVINRNEDGGFKCWCWGREPTVSKWIYVAEQTAINEAWDAVVALA